ARRIHRDQLVAGRRGERVHRRLLLRGRPEGEAERLAGAVEAVAGEVVETPEVGREVAAAPDLDAERVDRAGVGVVVAPGRGAFELHAGEEAVDVGKAGDRLEAQARRNLGGGGVRVVGVRRDLDLTERVAGADVLVDADVQGALGLGGRAGGGN